MAKNKSLKVLSTASVAGMVAAAVLSSQAFAAVDAYSVKVDNDVFQYSKADLTDSFLASKAGEAAPLYDDFTAKFAKASGFYAFHDAKTGKYVSVADITEKYLEAKAAGTEFVVDTYTESSDAKVIEVPTVKKVVVKDGKVVIEEDQQQQGELKVESVSAINLKQVQIKFNKPVDKTTATDKDNYSLSDATKQIEAATLSNDKLTVTLELKATTTLSNQIEYKLSFNNVKAEGSTSVLKVTDHKFTPVDSTLPTVASVEALGNKTVKVTFNEPIKVANTSSFMIDGKPVVGYTSVTGNEVVIKVYSALANGSHTVNVKNVEDFANFKSISADSSFTVVEDKDAPVVASVEKCTFEEVTLRFSEDVDPSTVIGTNAYWMQGTTKKYADYNVTKVSGNTYTFTFNANKLQYATDLYVTGVKDYSGNAIATDTKVQVTPVLDQSRPEVINAEVDDSYKIVTIKFTKKLNAIEANKSEHYIIKDKDGKEVNKLKTAQIQSDAKTVKVTLGSALETGKDYTLEVSGVSDDTTLKNVMLPYSKALNIVDKTGPDSSKIDVKKSDNSTIVVTFPEAMAVSGDGSVVDTSKYFYSIDNGTTWKTLPSGTVLNITADAKAALITLPADVDFNKVNAFRVQLVKDVAGNYITGLTKDVTGLTAAANPTKTAINSTANNKIEVTFDRTILANTVNAGDFKVQSDAAETLSVVGAELKSGDDKTVVLTLSDATKLSEDGKYNNSAIKVSTVTSPTTSSPEGKTITAFAAATIDAEKIPATINKVEGSLDGKSIKVTFNEDLGPIADADSAATDVVVTDKDGNVLTPVTAYTVSATGKTLTISFVAPAAQTGIMKVAMPSPRFIKDVANNVVNKADTVEVDVDNAAPIADATTPVALTTNAVASDNALAANDVVTIKFSEALKSASNVDVTAIQAAVDAAFGSGNAVVATSNHISYTITIASDKNVDLTTNGKTITLASGAVSDEEGNTGSVTFTVKDN